MLSPNSLYHVKQDTVTSPPVSIGNFVSVVKCWISGSPVHTPVNMDQD